MARGKLDGGVIVIGDDVLGLDEALLLDAGGVVSAAPWPIIMLGGVSKPSIRRPVSSLIEKLKGPWIRVACRVA